MGSSNHPRPWGRQPISCGAVIALLAALPLTASAWEVKSFYPTSSTPVLPTPQEAQRLADQAPLIFRTLGHAHRQSLRLSWKGVAPPGAPPDAD